MELNHDCVRTLLLEIEANKKIGKSLTEYNFKDNIVFETFDFDTVMYTLLKLKEAKFLDCDIVWSENKPKIYKIGDISWTGHEFLDNIRDNKTWLEVKNVASKTSSMSITLMGKLAYQYLLTKFS